MPERPRFHRDFLMRDLAEACPVFGNAPGHPQECLSDERIDFDFFGHRMVAHLSPNATEHKAYNQVDGDEVRVPHFGAILSMTDGKKLAAKLMEQKFSFIIASGRRLQGSQAEIRGVTR